MQVNHNDKIMDYHNKTNIGGIVEDIIKQSYLSKIIEYPFKLSNEKQQRIDL
jgi:hypothetical protein